MSTRIAINGFGRIGRCVLRALNARSGHNLEVVAINDLTDSATLRHLLKYDSVHGTYAGDVVAKDGALEVDGKSIQVLAERDPAKLPWKDLGVDIVVESTGFFRSKDGAGKHLQAGANRVVISAPGKSVDGTFCYGVNHETFDKSKHTIVSNASCTTNCLAPLAKVLDDAFGIEHGLMTTIHAVTNDQKILDLPHSDLRRARAAFESMIPTTTGAAAAVGLVLPHLNGKLDGFAVRVPTRNVSLVDLVARVKKSTTEAEVVAAMEKAAAGPLNGVLAVSHEPLVSIDYTGNANSSTLDASLTSVMEGNLIKVVSWYDNEWGYSNRMVDLTAYIAKQTQ